MGKVPSIVRAAMGAAVLLVGAWGPTWAQRSAGPFGDFGELTVIGRAEPNVRKATAIVNGDIITDTDVDQRLALVLAANRNRVSEEEREILRLQVLRNLIDEKLQIQEAAAHDIRIPDAEVDEAYARVARNFRQTPEQFSEFLRQAGSSPASLKHQIRSELAWSRLLRKRVEPFVAVGDDEVRAILARLEQAKGREEVRVGEIFLSATPETMDRVMADARRIVEAIRAGASFVAYARQFSEASTAAVGGDLGWVLPDQLSPEVAAVVRTMARGTVSDPIPVPGGVEIVAVIDRRQVLTANPADALVSLKQITVPVPPGMTEAEARKLAQRMQDATRDMGGCGRAEEVAASLGGEVVANDGIRLGDLPAPLQEIVARLPVGGATPAFGSQRDGLRLLILCGRDDPPAGGPSFDAIYAQLADERVNSAARRYLRDLRRDAVIDYR
ncbi:MAG: SurA N-terminal domain-containing protein [Sphingomonadaceae bacterium]|uniref:peptidylprolyl isomerase n=1 Tax=Thermaurantiacus sp. TaxID=2820283 RepID=UPI00298EE937|nr:peptidylprolyl isomerase [Thermaurantiacus sp.]MCS6986694.1 SurA N-terminal domain-containing protein [Sphingomonadaceae bacterium]MDW8414043.1 SurA N-terminal domain-containing protein [Thermaurantiacus sp.]